MVNVEMFTIQNTVEQPTLHQHFSLKKGRPTDWAHDGFYYTLDKIVEDGDNVTYWVSRPLVTPNETDYQISKNVGTEMVFANGLSPFNFHANKGFFEIFIHSNNKIDVTLDGDIPNYHKIHGLCMYFTWGLMTFLLFVSGRYMKALYLA